MNQQVIEALRRSRYRILEGDDELEELYRLRYKCYLDEKAIVSNETGSMVDAFDGTVNCINVAVDMDGRMMAAVRLHLITPLTPVGPTLSVFPELQDLLCQGQVLLDPTRFVVDPANRQQRVPLHFLALRIPVLAALHYQVDTVLAPVRTEHAAFYIRYLGHRLLYGPRPYLGLTKPLQLMTTNVVEQREAILRRTPALGPIPNLPQADIPFPSLEDLREDGTAVGSSDAA